MTTDRNFRWVGFFAASLLAHAALLTWVEFSSSGVTRASSAIRVMLAPAGRDSSDEKTVPRVWQPASATRSRDLFERTAEPRPMTPPATTGDVLREMKKAVVSAKKSPPEAPAPRNPVATKTVAMSETIPSGDSKRADFPAAPESATDNAVDSRAIATGYSGGMASVHAGVERNYSALTAAAPAAPTTRSAVSGEAARASDGALLALLHRAIDRGKRYPSLARRQRREGTATVRFRLSPSGEMDAIDIDRSSGFRALDTAAISAVSSVAPFAPAQTLLSEVTRFKVDVTFRLN